MQRRTRLASILGGILSVFLILPYFFGMIVKHYTDVFLQNENHSLGNVMGIQLSLDQYHGGWFHSSAMLKIEKRTASNGWEVSKQIPIEISHGPIFRYQGRLAVGVGKISSLDQPANDQSLYHITFREDIGFIGERGGLVLVANKTSAYQPNFQMDLLTVKTKSNLSATHFAFDIAGQGLHFQEPDQSMTVGVKKLQTKVVADYLSDRHWKLTVGLGLHQDQLTMMPNGGTPVTATAENISLANLHFDTQQLAGILSELIKLKQSADANQPTKPSDWIALFQQMLTQLVHRDTAVEVKGFSVAAPMGQADVGYVVSFPALPTQHDYFDIATHNVGNLEVVIPSWKLDNADGTTEFALSNFRYSDNNNTVFSRHSEMTVGAFDVRNLQSNDQNPAVYGTGLDYSGSLQGDPQHLTQAMQWHLMRLCFGGSCFDKIKGKLMLSNMDFAAFRGIADATQKIVQYNTAGVKSVSDRWMELATAYEKLVTPKTELVISHDMMTPAGEVQVEGKMNWPALASHPVSATTTPDVFWAETAYQLNMIFPASYVDNFVQEASAMPAAVPVAPAAPAAAPSTPDTAAVAPAVQEPPMAVQLAQFFQYLISEGYLKKVGDAYTVDLAGQGATVTINGVPWKASVSQ